MSEQKEDGLLIECSRCKTVLNEKSLWITDTETLCELCYKKFEVEQ